MKEFYTFGSAMEDPNEILNIYYWLGFYDKKIKTNVEVQSETN